jgi:outer membrane lipoprotein-sorting protein
VWYNAPSPGEQGDRWVRNAPTWFILGVCALVLTGCLSHRMTGVEVVSLAQRALSETQAHHFILDVDIDTDLVKDSLSVEVWEALPDRIKLVVLSAETPQFQQLAFTTDGTESALYLSYTNEVTVGPAELVKMPTVLDTVIRARRDWIQTAAANEARVIAIERQRGLVVYRIEIPLDGNGSAQVWIDARDWLVRQVVYQDKFLGTGTIQVREMLQVHELSDSSFELSIPDDAVPIQVSKEDD